MKRGHKVTFATCNNRECRGSWYFFFMVSFKIRGVILNWYPTWNHPLKWGDYFWALVSHTLALLGYSRIKFRQNSWNFWVCHFILGNFGENKAQEIQQNCSTTVGNSMTKNQDPWKCHMIFFWLGENSTLFYLISGIFMWFSIPLEIPCSLSLDFFGIANNTCK